MSDSMDSSHAQRVTDRSPAVAAQTTASFIDLPWGTVRVLVGPRGLTALDLHTPFAGKYPTAPASDPAHRAAHKELRAYARGQLTRFSVPLDPRGTVFQTAVWRTLMNIPYGTTRTYGDIAAAIGRPRAARAVGMACRSNPIGLVIPCHRVVGADGSLTGYAGGLTLKAKLLQHESTH
jgi:methylated-DNA-[protein]-cysteine S-methyltransferase